MSNFFVKYRTFEKKTIANQRRLSFTVSARSGLLG